MALPLRRPAALRWLAIGLLLLTALALPAHSHAAPLAQDSGALPGVYRTEPMDNEFTGDTLQITLTLFDDGAAEWVTDFTESGSTGYTAGTWEVDDEGLLQVTLETRFLHQGGQEEPIEPPYAVPFTVEGDTLLSPDYLEYGPKDLLLARADEEPVSFRDADGGLRADLKTGLDDFPDELFVGSYRTQDFVYDELTIWFVLDLFEDGTLRIEYPEGVIEGGAYSQGIWRNNGDGTIDVEITADFDADGEIVEEYDPPEEFSVLDRLESGGLVARDILLPSSEQLIFTRAEYLADSAPEVDLAGVYAGAVQLEAGPTLLGMMLYLDVDGTGRASLVALTSDGLLQTLDGIWEIEGATVTFTPTVEISGQGSEMQRTPRRNEPGETFTIDGDRLIGEEITLVRIEIEPEGMVRPGAPAVQPTPAPLPTATPAPQPTVVAGEDRTFMVGREQLSAGIQVVLSLNGDGTASLSTQLGPDAEFILESGVWETLDDGAILLMLTADLLSGEEYSEPILFVFEQPDSRTLVAVDYNFQRYGEDLVLYDTRDY